MSKYDAKIECVVNRPFMYCGRKYEKGDIFSINPNNRLHKTFLTSNKVYALPEEHYEYICTRQYKEFLNKSYGFGDVVDFSGFTEQQKTLAVKRGYVKKVIIKTATKEEEKVSYTAYAKSKNLKYADIKTLYKERYNEVLPHHQSAISKEIFDKLEIILTKEED